MSSPRGAQAQQRTATLVRRGRLTVGVAAMRPRLDWLEKDMIKSLSLLVVFDCFFPVAIHGIWQYIGIFYYILGGNNKRG